MFVRIIIEHGVTVMQVQRSINSHINCYLQNENN